MCSTNNVTIAKAVSSKLVGLCSSTESLVLKSPSTYHKCLWNIVIKMLEENLDKSEANLHYFFQRPQIHGVIKALLQIYKSLKQKHNLQITKFDDLDFDKDALSYFGFIKAFYDTVMSWRDKVLKYDATWNDIIWLKQNHQQFHEISELIGSEDELQPFSESTELLENIEKEFSKRLKDIKDILICGKRY